MADTFMGLSEIAAGNKNTNPSANTEPAKTPAQTNTKSGDENLSFSNIFTQTKAPEKDSKMVKSIIAQKEALQQMKPILGSAPDLEKTLEMEKQYRLRRKLHMVQIAFVGALFTSAALFGFLYTQLSPNFNYFGANITQSLADTNNTLRTLQTDLNKIHFLVAQQNLNDFSYQADRFFGNMTRSQNTGITPQEKALALTNVDEARKALPALLSSLRANLTVPMVAQTYQSYAEQSQTEEEKLSQAENDLRAALRKDKKDLNPNSQNPDDIQTIKLLENTLKLVGNRELINTVQSVSVDEFGKSLDDYISKKDLTKETYLRDLIGKILSSTKSELATIADVKHNRILWSSIIEKIETVTSDVYISYNPPLQPDSIRYTGYDFDTSTNKIVLSGVTKTANGENFTLMSDLMARLEQSQYFEQIQMRSFSKTRQGDGANSGYTSNFKIDLMLETSGYSPKDKSISLTKNIENTGVKR